jgi:hypothetical protein
MLDSSSPYGRKVCDGRPWVGKHLEGSTNGAASPRQPTAATSEAGSTISLSAPRPRPYWHHTHWNSKHRTHWNSKHRTHATTRHRTAPGGRRSRAGRPCCGRRMRAAWPWRGTWRRCTAAAAARRATLGAPDQRVVVVSGACAGDQALKPTTGGWSACCQSRNRNEPAWQ